MIRSIRRRPRFHPLRGTEEASTERGERSSDATNARSLFNLKKVKAPFAPSILDNVDIECFALLYDVAESLRRDINDDVPQFVHLRNKQNVRCPFPFFHPLYFSPFFTSVAAPSLFCSFFAFLAFLFLVLFYLSLFLSSIDRQFCNATSGDCPLAASLK